MSKHIVLLFLLVVCSGGCSSMREGTTGKVRGDVLTSEEIATTKAQNAYDAITLKRPFFLKSRGPRSLSSAPAGQTVEFPVVYLDGMYYGEIESLRNITVEDIKEIDYLDFNAATVRFGTGHTGGIILVLSKRNLLLLTPDTTRVRD
ncbi:MAG: Plug domain-containing protein [Ignavibacteriales bacterium]|nr:Plug domain-containing protein [Ignavibacteriales bacterium]